MTTAKACPGTSRTICITSPASTQHSLIDFSVVHKDTLFFSLLCAAITLLLLRIAARKATPGVPGKFQVAVEMLVEYRRRAGQDAGPRQSASSSRRWR